jgi:hypothetical protein
MASVQVTAWDVAQAIGLCYVDSERDDDYQTTYEYYFNGKEIFVKEDYYNVNDRDTANEYAAKKLFEGLAKLIVID